MRTKTTFKMLALALLVSVTSLHSLGEETEVLSREEILTLLPRGIDMEDANDITRYNKLVARGSSAHEVLGEELLRVDDWITASRIIAIFVDSSGDRSVAMKYLNRFLELPRSNDKWPAVRSQATDVIKKFQIERASNALDQPVNPLPSVQPPAPKKAPEAKPASTQSEEPTTSARWSIIVVLIVAATGLLWLVHKNRK